MAREIDLPGGGVAEFPDGMSDDAIASVLQKQFPPQQSSPQQGLDKEGLKKLLGPSDFTKSFASTPARMLKSGMQMVGAGDYVPEFVSNVAAEGDKSVMGRIAGDVAGTGGIKAGAGALVNAVKGLNAAKGFLPAVGRTAELATYGAGQGAITTPDDQANAAKWGAAGGAAVPVLGGAVKFAAQATKHALGATTGTGAGAVEHAFKDTPGFVENMRGTVPASNVVEQARTGVKQLRTDMHTRYSTAKGGWAGDTARLDFMPILKAESDAAQKFSFQGIPQPGVRDVQSAVNQALVDWSNNAAKNPAFMTVEGLDALKRHIGDIIPEDIGNRTGRAYVSEVVEGIKKSIIDQAPQYKAAMNDYWKSSSQLDEITRDLSLGDKATVDTALRKLQTLTKPRAGQRTVSAEALKQVGADIVPQISGQAMGELTPQGMQRVGGVLAGVANPYLLPAFSPRIVGETARYAGKAVNNQATQTLLDVLRRAAPSATRIANEEQ